MGVLYSLSKSFLGFVLPVRIFGSRFDLIEDWGLVNFEDELGVVENFFRCGF